MKKLYYSWWCKGFVSLLLLLSAVVTVLCAMGYVATMQFNFQSQNYDHARGDALSYLVWEDAYKLQSTYKDTPNFALSYAENQGLDFAVVDKSGSILLASKGWQGVGETSFELGADADGITTIVCLDRAMENGGLYAWADGLIRIGYALRFAGLAVVAGLIALTMLLFFWRMSMAGYQPEEEGVSIGFHLPLDLVTIATAFALVVAVNMVAEAHFQLERWEVITVFSAGLVGGLVVFLWYCTFLATCIKTGHWYRYTAIGWLFRQCKRGAKGLYGKVQALSWGVVTTGVAVAALVCGGGLVCLLPHDLGTRLVAWSLLSLAGLAGGVYLVWMLRALERGAQTLSAGDLQATVDTRRLVCGFRGHGENLNAISHGLQMAVEEQMKSQRLKTQLITNVSHDLKTPLTSILNYTDLIATEPCENPKIAEYSAVLVRQAQRLKTLTENLMEASKVTTGNVDVTIAPCNVTVLAEQIAGEYAQKLDDCALTMVTRLPEPPLTIQADGQLLWRVFDNLMNNICKYSQPHTRVYLTAEAVATGVEITFKNTSRYELDGNPEDLLERFSRGDSARHTEGNGLGLSIAQSLTELQHGTFALVVDGDLFKVVVTLPA